jgi:LacI family transcriptional regulator
VDKLFDQYPEMDSIFVANDQMALSVLHAISERGLKIPGEFGVVGFDNIPESAYFWPALTTVQQDHYDIARIAVAEMIKIIESGWHGLDPMEPRSIMVPPTLVVRESSVRVKE